MQTMLTILVLALAAESVVAATGRELLQSGTSCPTKIPGCRPRRCTTRILGSVETYVCLRCQNGMVPALGSDGRSVIQCICPPGTHMTGTTTKACTPCAVGEYCPGGDRSADSSSDDLGTKNVCGNDLTTKSARATRASDCVAKAGFVLPATPGSSAVQCTGNTYAPDLNRLKSCLPCQSGLAAPTTFTGVRYDKNDVCQVPPGKFWELNVVRDCPVGLYRSDFVRTDSQAAISCLSCPKGWTTSSKGKGAKSDCNKLMPGYMVAGTTVGAAPTIPVMPTDANFDPPSTAECPEGHYYDGKESGVFGCKRCPYGAVTLKSGSVSADDCVVPPGYFASGTSAATGQLTKCPVTSATGEEEGYYRPAWKPVKEVISASGDGKDVCVKCGKGILSEAADRDEHPAAASGDKVAATSASCYIKSGWGITFDPQNFAAYVAIKPCPANTYGVAAKTNGLINAPCKACAKNLLSSAGSNTFEDCKNPGGFGYTTEGANQCPDNFYAEAESMKPCEPCPEGRVTDYVPGDGSKQDNINKCKVPAGSGVFDSAATDPWNPSSPTEATAAKPCPAGYTGAGDASTAATTSNPMCAVCPTGQSTSAVGATTCDVCAAGYGQANGGACAECNYGSWQMGTTASCTTCPSTTFQDFVGDSYVSYGITTFKGAKNSNACVPRYAQLPNPAGDSMALAAGMLAAPEEIAGAANAAVKTCVEACPTDKCCIAEMQETSSGLSCSRGTFDPAAPLAGGAAQGARMYYKLPPSEFAAASVNTTRAKTISSGIYAICNIDAYATEAGDGKVGTSTDPTKVEDENYADWTECTNVQGCKEKCDKNAACWGFVQVANKGLALRGGEMKAGGRAFFVSPDAGTAGLTLSW